jgi:lysozyme
MTTNSDFSQHIQLWFQDEWKKFKQSFDESGLITTNTTSGSISSNTSASTGGYTSNTIVTIEPARTGELLVVDIYHGDNGGAMPDFVTLAKSGVVGVIHKASQGKSIVDQTYANRRKIATAQGLLWGAYHFLDFSADAKTQADHFLSVANPDSNTLVALDWETVGNKEPSADLAKQFLQEIESKLGRKAVIYSGNVAKEQLHTGDIYFGSHRLWLCEYGKKAVTQSSWSYPWLWQYSETGSVKGISGHVDVNTIVSPMTVTRLRSEWAS